MWHMPCVDFISSGYDHIDSVMFTLTYTCSPGHGTRYENGAKRIAEVALRRGATVRIVTEAEGLPLGATKQSILKPGDTKQVIEPNAFYVEQPLKRLSLVPISAWQSDSMADSCNSCSAPFTKVRRRHHCRGCGLVFCDACCSKTAENPVRVCATCRPDPRWRPVCFAVASPDSLVQNVRALQAIIDDIPTAASPAANASTTAAAASTSTPFTSSSAAVSTSNAVIGSAACAGAPAAASAPTKSLELVMRLHQARKICDQDIMKYTMEWESTLQREPTAADELDALCKRITSAIPPKYAGDGLKQPVPLGGCSDGHDILYLKRLQEAFAEHGDSIFAVARMVTEKEGAVFKQGPLKKNERSVEKADLAYVSPLHY